MELWRKQADFSHDVAVLIDYIFSNGYFCTFGEAYRTPEQAEIYAKQGKGIKNSLHCNRLAIDLNLYSPQGVYLTDTKDYEKYGSLWESLRSNNRWGGRFTRADGNHFEQTL